MSEADKPSEQEGTLTFWDHLDELRAVLIRILVITAIAAVAAFCLKEELLLWCWHPVPVTLSPTE